MAYEIELIADEQAQVGEGPVWDPNTGILYWTDIYTGRLFAYEPATGDHRQIYSGVWVGGLAVNRAGGLTLATVEGLQLWRSDDDFVWLHHDPDPDRIFRFNDVIAGPDGSFYAGSYFEDKPGALYRFHPDLSYDTIDQGIGCSNGMGFSPDRRTFYHTDSTVRTIYAYDYDTASHQVGNRRSFVELPNTEGLPDGLTVDAEGFVWSANWGGSAVIRFDPAGKEERRIRFPVTQTSSVMFGGPDLTDLYVTSAYLGTGDPPSDLDPVGYDHTAPRGGQLYRVRTDIKGLPEFETNFAWPAS